MENRLLNRWPGKWYNPTQEWTCVWFLTISFLCIVAVVLSIVNGATNTGSIIVRVVAVLILGIAIGQRRKHEDCRPIPPKEPQDH